MERRDPRAAAAGGKRPLPEVHLAPLWPRSSLASATGCRGGMAEGGGGGGVSPPDSGGLLQQILSLRLIPRVGNATSPACVAALCHFTEMWYGVFLWALVSSLFFHIPAGLLALFTLRRHRYGRFMPLSIFLMSLIGPLAAGTLTSAAIAGVYRAAGKMMIPFEALTWGVGQTFCVVMISFLRILATL